MQINQGMVFFHMYFMLWCPFLVCSVSHVLFLDCQKVHHSWWIYFTHSKQCNGMKITISSACSLLLADIKSPICWLHIAAASFFIDFDSVNLCVPLAQRRNINPLFTLVTFIQNAQIDRGWLRGCVGYEDGNLCAVDWLIRLKIYNEVWLQMKDGFSLCVFVHGCVNVCVFSKEWLATVSLGADLDRAEQMRWFRNQSIVPALIASVSRPEQILWEEVDDGVKSLSWGFCFLLQNNHLWKRLKSMEINCFANEKSAA